MFCFLRTTYAGKKNFPNYNKDNFPIRNTFYINSKMVLRQNRDVTMKHGFSEVGGETVVRDVATVPEEQNTNN